MGYREDLSIDKFALDTEWERQPMLFMDWVERSTDSLIERDRKKEQLDFVKAELDSAIRISPENFGIVKVTESAISSAIILDKKFRDIQNEYSEARKNAMIIAGAREAMEHKKKALESMTSLWIAGYYADPKIPTKAREIASEQTTESLRSKLRRRT